MYSKQIALLASFALTLASSNLAVAANKPCSGKMGGIAQCVDGKFLCNNGKFSRSKKICNPSIYGGSGPKTGTSSHSQKKNAKGNLP
jgi:hypothetical protein